MTWTSGERITIDRLRDINDRNTISGYVGLDGLKAIPSTITRYRCYMGGFGSNFTQVLGSWSLTNNANQTDFDDILINPAGYLFNGSPGTNLDEIKWSNILLNAGTYTIKIACVTYPDKGILELLHGSTSIGTFDCYTSYLAWNTIITFTYSPTVITVADFRLRVNGKNGSSTGYSLNISRIEIFKIQ